MKNKKIVDEALMKMGEGAFWKEFRDRDERYEDRYIIVDRAGNVTVFKGKLREKPRKVEV